MINSVFINLLKRNIPRWLVLIIDVYIVLNTFILSYLIRFDFSLSFDTSKFLLQFPIVIIASLIGFFLIGSYKGIIKHTGIRDSINVFLASIIIFVLMLSFVMLNHKFKWMSEFTIPRSIVIIHFLLNITL